MTTTEKMTISEAYMYYASTCLDDIEKVLKPFHGLKFTFQGQVFVTRNKDSIVFDVAPLEKIELKVIGDNLWTVEFIINDADDRGWNWEFSGPLGHVEHAFKGYIVKKMIDIAPMQQIIELARL